MTRIISWRARLLACRVGCHDTRGTGDVKDFPRIKLGPWDLLYRALRAVVGERNREGGGHV